MSYCYCNDCKRELCSENVTFEEKCDTCGHSAIWIETEDDESVEQMLQELKECRESSLRPATKFLYYFSFEEQLEHVKSEIKEIEEAYKDYENNPTGENFIKCLDEMTDAQHSLQTLKETYGISRSCDIRSHIRVIAKNQARGYYCE